MVLLFTVNDWRKELLNYQKIIHIEISAHQLQFILDGIYLSSIKKRVRYEHTIVSNFIGESGVSASV